MKFRIRGPSSQAVVDFDDTATVDNLRKTVATETSLMTFDVKYGYPPKTLPLDQYSASTLLCDLDVKLDGQQLIVGKRDAVLTSEVTPPARPANASTSSTPSSSISASRNTKQLPKPLPSTGKTAAPGSSSGISFGNLGTAPIPRKNLTTPTPRSEDVSPPAPSLRKRKNDFDTEIVLPERGGALVLRVLPDDNSCLFRAVGRAVMPDLDVMTSLRRLVAEAIQANPVKYTKAVLDNKEPDDYCGWIEEEDSWGGQIELDILSQYFDLEIYSIDTKSLRIDKYNEGKPRRCYIAYSLIHYDSIAFSEFGSQPEEDTTQFDSSDDTILKSAVMLCQRLNEKGYYTDTAAINIRCKECGSTFIGQKAATEHAKMTAHYDMEQV